MDLESGYWQIPMKKEDREKTTFVTADGTFHFLVMPFRPLHSTSNIPMDHGHGTRRIAVNSVPRLPGRHYRIRQ